MSSSCRNSRGPGQAAVGRLTPIMEPKRLNLMVDPTDGHWRIYSETWSRYEDVPEFPKM